MTFFSGFSSIYMFMYRPDDVMLCYTHVVFTLSIAILVYLQRSMPWHNICYSVFITKSNKSLFNAMALESSS